MSSIRAPPSREELLRRLIGKALPPVVKTKRPKIQRGGNVNVAREAYERPGERAKEITDKEGNRYVLDENRNLRDFVVYRNPDTSKAYLGVRGTELFKGRQRAADDLLEDALITLGIDEKEFSNRNKKATRIANELIGELGRENVETVGHSLGGKVALNLNRDLGIRGTVYNPGSTPLSIFGNLQKKPVKGLKVFSTGVDPVSGSVFYTLPTVEPKVRVPVKEGADVHALASFEGLDDPPVEVEQTGGKDYVASTGRSVQQEPDQNYTLAWYYDLERIISPLRETDNVRFRTLMARLDRVRELLPRDDTRSLAEAQRRLESLENEL